MASNHGTCRRLERHFRIAGQTVSVHETSIEDGGLGHCVWDSGVALSIWLSINARETVHGRRVLELGSGVGITGIAVLLAGATSAVLSDFIPEGESSARASMQDGTSQDDAARQADTLLKLLPNNAESSGVEPELVTTMGLDWNQCLDESFQAAEKFPVVIGSDLIYEVDTAKALCAAVLKHIADDGVLYLMSQTGRPGVAEVHRLLEEAGSLTTQDFVLENDYGVTDVMLATFRPGPSQG